MYTRALKSNAINLYILKQLPRIKKDKHKENSIFRMILNKHNFSLNNQSTCTLIKCVHHVRVL